MWAAKSVMGHKCPAVSFDSQDEPFVLSFLRTHLRLSITQPSLPVGNLGKPFCGLTRLLGLCFWLPSRDFGSEGYILSAKRYAWLLPDPLAFISKV